MVQLYQFLIRRRAKGLLWLSGSELIPSKWGLVVGGCIHPHGWPVVALGIGHMRQSPVAWMVSAYSFMEFHQYILPLLGGEAFKIRAV